MSMYLYETHLPVQRTEASQAFYLDVLSLEFAYRDPHTRYRVSVDR